MRASASSRPAPVRPTRNPVAIIEHPDVRRMLLRMRALTEGARALLYYTAGHGRSRRAGD
jgi:alkylation response protein AidB-like acyl-CoA dehydrogenase